VDPVGKALWFIESHFAEEVTLDVIATVSGVSRFHISRAFGEATGHSLMQYVRARRLTEAARALGDGAPDILSVALDAGYGSHEAFTRAFRERFGLTPEALRAQHRLDGIELVEALRRDHEMTVDLEQPRIEQGATLLVAGLSDRFTHETVGGIPSLWQRFSRYFGHVPGQVGRRAYGVMFNTDDEGSLEYMAGVEVSSFDGLPAELNRIRIPAQTYAVFSHRGHVSTIRSTMNAIWRKWLPESGLKVIDAPDFERYGEDFDPATGSGTIEIVIAIEPNEK
jgi:AraC family transcriptional regulator